MSPGAQHELPAALGEVTDDALTSRYRVFQRVKGHRYSIDDVVTAWEAANAAPHATRVLDLGTGLGSVSISLAHALPEARIVGIEAQEISFGLLDANVRRNGLSERLRIEHGDIRDAELIDRVSREEGPFDLVSGTPPYFLPHEATQPPDSQKAHARFELRGGVEAYLKAGARAVSEGGAIVLCASVKQRARLDDAIEREDLALHASRELIPREGKDALFLLVTLRRTPCASPVTHPPFIARNAAGERTAMERAVRGFFGMVSRASEPPSPPISSERDSRSS
jgi:tRNA1(Val) A37 N6-methylase TrmN6